MVKNMGKSSQKLATRRDVENSSYPNKAEDFDSSYLASTDLTFSLFFFLAHGKERLIKNRSFTCHDVWDIH